MNAIASLQVDDATKSRLYADALDLTREALKHATLNQMEASYTRRTAAAHEAGHCIVHTTVEGDPVRYVRIFPRRGLWLGECMTPAWELTPNMPSEAWLRQARIAVAGWCGERFAGLDVPGSSIDELALAQRMVGHVAQDDSEYAELWKQLLCDTLAILQRYKSTHQELTAALVRERKVQGRRLTALLRDVQPANQNGGH